LGSHRESRGTGLEPSDASKPVVILIVEDEMIVRRSTTDILQDAGYLVLEARDGVEAIAVIELRDDVAALFTDVTMPNMNGNRARPSCSREMAAHWHRGHVRGAPTQRETGAAGRRSLPGEAVQAQAAPSGDPSGVAPGRFSSGDQEPSHDAARQDARRRARLRKRSHC